VKSVLHIKDVLTKFIEAEPKISHLMAEADAVNIWETVVGKEAAANSQATIVKNGVLYILASSSVWAQQLSLKRKDIAGKINATLKGREVIKDIKFRTGELRGR